MQNIINFGPAEITLREKICFVRHQLIQIDQTKSYIKSADSKVALEIQNANPDESKNNVKNIVRRSTTRQAFFRRNHKT